MNSKIETIAILKDFHKITGARVSLHDIAFTEIAGYPENPSDFCAEVQKNPETLSKCVEADIRAFKTVCETGRPYTYKCHCGLFETVAPIFSYGELSGYFMMGQVTDADPSGIQLIKSLSAGHFSSKKELDRICDGIPRLCGDSIDSYLRILEILAEYMTQTNRMPPKTADLAESVKRYIHTFYGKRLTVSDLCDTFGRSRVTVMNSFKKKYGLTVGEYLTAYRLEKSEEMLKTSRKSVKSIAADCGFHDQNYFSKAFFRKNSCTPTAYRRKFSE